MKMNFFFVKLQPENFIVCLAFKLNIKNLHEHLRKCRVLYYLTSVGIVCEEEEVGIVGLHLAGEKVDVQPPFLSELVLKTAVKSCLLLSSLLQKLFKKLGS